MRPGRRVRVHLLPWKVSVRVKVRVRGWGGKVRVGGWKGGEGARARVGRLGLAVGLRLRSESGMG